MFISHYRQRMSIALQHAYVITILQHVATLSHNSSSLPHIPASATSWLVIEDGLLALRLPLHSYYFDGLGFPFMCLRLLWHALYFLWMDFHPPLCTGFFFSLTGTFISVVLLSNFDKRILFKHVKLVLLDTVSALMQSPNKGFEKRGWRVQEVDPRRIPVRKGLGF